MRSSLTAKGPGLEQLRKLARELKTKPQVKIGVLGAAVYHGDELTNAELAAIHEFGAPRAGVPERSFLRSTADLKRREWLALLVKVLQAAVDGKTTVQVALELVGQKAVADVVARIRNGAGIPPPLKPATIAAKGSTRPLVDTGRLVYFADQAVPASELGARIVVRLGDVLQVGTDALEHTGSTRPLVDTGRLVQSIGYEVVRPGRRP